MAEAVRRGVTLRLMRDRARIDVMLGGRESEALAIGDITTGAENDLVQATRLVRRMITRWGMGSLGPVAFQADDEQPFLGYLAEALLTDETIREDALTRILGPRPAPVEISPLT